LPNRGTLRLSIVYEDGMLVVRAGVDLINRLEDINEILAGSARGSQSVASPA